MMTQEEAGQVEARALLGEMSPKFSRAIESALRCYGEEKVLGLKRVAGIHRALFMRGKHQVWMDKTAKHLRHPEAREIMQRYIDRTGHTKSIDHLLGYWNISGGNGIFDRHYAALIDGYSRRVDDMFSHKPSCCGSRIGLLSLAFFAKMEQILDTLVFPQLIEDFSPNCGAEDDTLGVPYIELIKAVGFELGEGYTPAPSSTVKVGRDNAVQLISVVCGLRDDAPTPLGYEPHPDLTLAIAK